MFEEQFAQCRIRGLNGDFYPGYFVINDKRYIIFKDYTCRVYEANEWWGLQKKVLEGNEEQLMEYFGGKVKKTYKRFL
ncbi:MAG: hypothetical protein ACHQ1D_01410 [Nitrososphaerales archaeon]